MCSNKFIAWNIHLNTSVWFPEPRSKFGWNAIFDSSKIHQSSTVVYNRLSIEVLSECLKRIWPAVTVELHITAKRTSCYLLIFHSIGSHAFIYWHVHRQHKELKSFTKSLHQRNTNSLSWLLINSAFTFSQHKFFHISCFEEIKNIFKHVWCS